MKKSRRLRELFDSGKVFTIAGGSCAFHAKMAEAAGFECAYMSGGFTSSFLLGIPDAGIMTLTEMVENARRMARATSIPPPVRCRPGLRQRPQRPAHGGGVHRRRRGRHPPGGPAGAQALRVRVGQGGHLPGGGRRQVPGPPWTPGTSWTPTS